MSKRPQQEDDINIDKRIKNELGDANANSNSDNASRNYAESHDSEVAKSDSYSQSLHSSGSYNAAIAAAAAAAAASHGSAGQSKTALGIEPTHLPEGKPAHGSEEWHKIRKQNHKEVEKRRRDNINSGIKELAQLIPTSDTNKSQILQRAVEYIKRLKENETNNIEKWTLEKLLTEQAVSELDASNTKLKQELERAYREIEHYKRLVEEKK